MDQRLPGGRFYGELLRQRTVAGLNLSETRYAPGTRLPRHSHARAYFCLIRHGSYREEYAGRQRACGPLMLAFHPPEELHAEHFGGSEVRSFNVELTPAWLSRVQEDRLRLDQPLDFEGDRAVYLAVQLLQEFDERDTAGSLAVEALFLELLGCCGRATHPGQRGAGPAWLSHVRDRLDDEFTDPPTVGGLAVEAGVHPCYLVTTFRRHQGCTVGDYVRRCRVRLACRHLADAELPLAQVALLAGFVDQSHFTRTFKRLVGTTPAAYRRLAARALYRSQS
jgi:AraC family transcriptional regulator